MISRLGLLFLASLSYADAFRMLSVSSQFQSRKGLCTSTKSVNGRITLGLKMGAEAYSDAAFMVAPVEVRFCTEFMHAFLFSSWEQKVLSSTHSNLAR